MSKNCYFCNSVCDELLRMGDYDTYDCKYCGKYIVTYSAQSEGGLFEGIKHIIAGYLEETKDKRTDLISIQSTNVDEIVNDYRVPVSTMRKLEKFLIYCYKRNDYIGQEFTTNHSNISVPGGKDRYYINGDSKRIGISYTKNTYELDGIIKAMEDLGWVVRQMTVPKATGLVFFVLTAKGLSYAEQLLKTNINSKSVFVAIEFHSDYLERLNLAIKPACYACGFDAFIITDVEFNNNINDEMIVGIKRSKFMIADFTHNNEGVYYEAGFAQGMGLEVIKACNKNWFNETDSNGKRINRLHFDIEHDNLILYKDFEEYEKLLKNRIRKTIKDAILED